MVRESEEFEPRMMFVIPNGLPQRPQTARAEQRRSDAGAERGPGKNNAVSVSSSWRASDINDHRASLRRPQSAHERRPNNAGLDPSPVKNTSDRVIWRPARESSDNRESLRRPKSAHERRLNNAGTDRFSVNTSDRVIWPTKDASDNRASVQRPQSARERRPNNTGNDRLPVKNRNDRVIWPTKDASDNRASDNRASVQRPQSARPQSAPLRRPQSAHERRRTDATMPLLLDNGGHSAVHGGSATLSRHNFREHYSPPSFFSRSKSDLMPSNPTLGRALGSSLSRQLHMARPHHSLLYEDEGDFCRWHPRIPVNFYWDKSNSLLKRAVGRKYFRYDTQLELVVETCTRSNGDKAFMSLRRRQDEKYQTLFHSLRDEVREKLAFDPNSGMRLWNVDVKPDSKKSRIGAFEVILRWTPPSKIWRNDKDNKKSVVLEEDSTFNGLPAANSSLLVEEEDFELGDGVQEVLLFSKLHRQKFPNCTHLVDFLVQVLASAANVKKRFTFFVKSESGDPVPNATIRIFTRVSGCNTYKEPKQLKADCNGEAEMQMPQNWNQIYVVAVSPNDADSLDPLVEGTRHEGEPAHSVFVVYDPNNLPDSICVPVSPGRTVADPLVLVLSWGDFTGTSEEMQSFMQSVELTVDTPAGAVSSRTQGNGQTQGSGCRAAAFKNLEEGWYHVYASCTEQPQSNNAWLPNKTAWQKCNAQLSIRGRDVWAEVDGRYTGSTRRLQPSGHYPGQDGKGRPLPEEEEYEDYDEEEAGLNDKGIDGEDVGREEYHSRRSELVQIRKRKTDADKQKTAGDEQLRASAWWDVAFLYVDSKGVIDLAIVNRQMKEPRSWRAMNLLVKDIWGVPIERARVVLRGQGKLQGQVMEFYFSNQDGLIPMVLPYGTFDADVTAPGFLSLQLNIDVQPVQRLGRDRELALISLEEIWAGEYEWTVVRVYEDVISSTDAEKRDKLLAVKRALQTLQQHRTRARDQLSATLKSTRKQLLTAQIDVAERAHAGLNVNDPHSEEQQRVRHLKRQVKNLCRVRRYVELHVEGTVQDGLNRECVLAVQALAAARRELSKTLAAARKVAPRVRQLGELEDLLARLEGSREASAGCCGVHLVPRDWFETMQDLDEHNDKLFTDASSEFRGDSPRLLVISGGVYEEQHQTSAAKSADADSEAGPNTPWASLVVDPAVTAKPVPEVEDDDEDGKPESAKKDSRSGSTAALLDSKGKGKGAGVGQALPRQIVPRDIARSAKTEREDRVEDTHLLKPNTITGRDPQLLLLFPPPRGEALESACDLIRVNIERQSAASLACSNLLLSVYSPKEHLKSVRPPNAPSHSFVPRVWDALSVHYREEEQQRGGRLKWQQELHLEGVLHDTKPTAE